MDSCGIMTIGCTYSLDVISLLNFVSVSSSNIEVYWQKETKQIIAQSK